MAVSDSTPLPGILGTLIPPEVAKDKQATVKWIDKVIFDPDRPCDSASVDRRLMLIRHLEDMMHTGFSNTADLRQHVDRFLDGRDGRRLPVAKAIKRARKNLGLSQVDLADQLGLKDHTLISKYESGKRVPPLKVTEWLTQAENVTQERRVKGNGRTPSIPVTSSRGNEAPILPDSDVSGTSPNPQGCTSADPCDAPDGIPAQGSLFPADDRSPAGEDEGAPSTSSTEEDSNV